MFHIGGGFRLCIFAIWLIKDCQCILLKDVGVPSFAIQGKEAVLTCDYDLENQDLYAVKWYKNGLEFYRFVPGSYPDTMTVYARPGVDVDKKRSDERQVTLTHLKMASTGRYRCEVSMEAPSFATVSNYGDMVVVVVPSSDPTIQGGKSRYEPGDMVDVNCTSKESKPAADLFWFINGEQADESLLTHYPLLNTTKGLHTAILGLKFLVLPEHFSSRGDMKLKCTATIDTIYWKSNEKSAEGLKQKRASPSQGGDGFSPPESAHGLSSGICSSQGAILSSYMWAIICFFGFR